MEAVGLRRIRYTELCSFSLLGELALSAIENGAILGGDCKDFGVNRSDVDSLRTRADYGAKRS